MRLIHILPPLQLGTPLPLLRTLSESRQQEPVNQEVCSLFFFPGKCLVACYILLRNSPHSSVRGLALRDCAGGDRPMGTGALSESVLQIAIGLPGCGCGIRLVGGIDAAHMFGVHFAAADMRSASRVAPPAEVWYCAQATSSLALKSPTAPRGRADLFQAHPAQTRISRCS